MTLGGLALAVGILVDDATVAIENTYRLMEEGRKFREAVVEGAAGIAKPALISTLAICCAFVSVLFLTDAPQFLFTPQALAVVFAMLASYVLSRTLVPILIDVLVRPERGAAAGRAARAPKPGRVLRARSTTGFERRLRHGSAPAISACCMRRSTTACVTWRRRRRACWPARRGLFVFVGPGLLPADRRRADDAACAHARPACGSSRPSSCSSRSRTRCARSCRRTSSA